MSHLCKIIYSVFSNCTFPILKSSFQMILRYNVRISLITLPPPPPGRNWSWLSTCSYSWTGTSWQSPELESSPRSVSCSCRAISEEVAALLPGTAPPIVRSLIRHMWAHVHVEAHRWEAESLTLPQCSFSLNVETFNISESLLEKHLEQHLNGADRNGTDRTDGKWASEHWCPHAAHVTRRAKTNTMRHGPFINHSRRGMQDI